MNPLRGASKLSLIAAATTATKYRIGDQVLALGNPFGIGELVSAGIVSGKNHDILDTPFDDYIQADAAINKGSPVSRRP